MMDSRKRATSQGPCKGSVGKDYIQGEKEDVKKLNQEPMGNRMGGPEFKLKGSWLKHWQRNQQDQAVSLIESLCCPWEINSCP